MNEEQEKQLINIALKISGDGTHMASIIFYAVSIYATGNYRYLKALAEAGNDLADEAISDMQ